MDNLRAIIKNVFCYISPEDILLEHTRYDDLSEDTFLKLGSRYIAQYSNDELQNMYNFFKNEFIWNQCKLRDMFPGEDQESSCYFNVFAALTIFNNAVLIEEDGEPKCQYAQLLRWRDMTTVLEEDLFITSFLAYRDGMSARHRRNFFWRPVIGHNNHELNALLQKGVAENHFHLKGSAPHFHISWISMMNNVDNKTFQSIFDDYNVNRLQQNLLYDPRYGAKDLSHRWRQAALIRAFLFCILKSTYLKLPDYKITTMELMELCSVREKLVIQNILRSSAGEMLYVDAVLRDLSKALDEKALSVLEVKVRQKCSAIYVRQHLLSEDMLKDASAIIQDNIKYLREEYGRDLDYALCEPFLLNNEPDRTNEILSGERWLLYQMFRLIYSQESTNESCKKDNDIQLYFNWFYLYLVIKADIRKELVQANPNVGFANFMCYQNRKEDFIDNTPYEKIYLKMAVRDTIYNQHIVSLETRIAPKNSMAEMSAAIRKYDRWIADGIEDSEELKELKDKYFYVVHFVKEPEIWIRQEKDEQYEYECRHYAKREEIKQQALAITQMRACGAAEASRIRGIDAASSEIWCRPEVFAQAFRYLKNHTVSDEVKKYTDVKCPCLRATYHVGEDFLDIVDGLRAIDEAVLFLNLHCGDRLGHALALGIDIDSWYEGKSNRILINKLGYLDNLMWLYAKIRKYGIQDCAATVLYIEKRFEEYFQEVYGNNITSDEIGYVIQNTQKYYRDKRGFNGYHNANLTFDINVYYDAWKLRGDNPAYYQEGFFRLHGVVFDEWDEYAVNKEYPINYKVRYNPNVAFLNYMYHYNPQVKYVGDQMIEVKVIPVVRDAVKKVASRMQRDIRNLGIGIETNPSSNYLIGTFRRYDKHPIVSWYNRGLTNNPMELQECPQMQVSINTDDQGVFATYIENEYAYLALAMEKCVDMNGDRIYNRAMIMKWLDDIRKMGIDQSFVS